MADTRLTIFQSDGTTAAIDYRTESSNLDGRQVIVIGDSSSNNAVAAVQATDPNSNAEGLVVRDVNTSAIAGFLGGTLGVYLNSTSGTVNVALKPGTIAVSLDPGHLLGSVTANAGTGTFTVAFDPGHELGSIKQINNTVGVYLDSTQGTVAVQLKAGTIAVSLDPGHLLGSVTANAGTGSFNVQFDPGHTLGKVDAGLGTFNVALDPGHTIGIIGDQATIVIPITTAGNSSAVSVSGKTIAGPTSSRVLKVFAFSLTTTAQTSLTAKFTNGAGTSPTVFYEAALQAPAQGIAGSNMAVTPPGYLWATASGATLSLLLDSASLVHYMVSYFEESA